MQFAPYMVVAVVSLYFSFKRCWINEEFSTPMNRNITTSISSTSTELLYR